MAPVYGVAELAAEIIRAQYNGLTPPYVSATLTSTTSTSTTHSPSSTSSKRPSSAALNLGASIDQRMLVTMVLGVALLAFVL